MDLFKMILCLQISAKGLIFSLRMRLIIVLRLTAPSSEDQKQKELKEVRQGNVEFDQLWKVFLPKQSYQIYQQFRSIVLGSDGCVQEFTRTWFPLWPCIILYLQFKYLSYPDNHKNKSAQEIYVITTSVALFHSLFFRTSTI